MLSNRSIPRGPVIPVLAYPDVDQAAAWLCAAFGFTVRLRIFRHRIQMNVGEGGLVVRELREGEAGTPLGAGHSVMIRVADADAHCKRAMEHGARITQEPTMYPFGERQYNAEDFAGHSWTFSQSVADVIRRIGVGLPNPSSTPGRVLLKLAVNRFFLELLSMEEQPGQGSSHPIELD